MTDNGEICYNWISLKYPSKGIFSPWETISGSQGLEPDGFGLNPPPPPPHHQLMCFFTLSDYSFCLSLIQGGLKTGTYTRA